MVSADAGAPKDPIWVGGVAESELKTYREINSYQPHITQIGLNT